MALAVFRKSPSDLWVERVETLLDGAEVALEQHLARSDRNDREEAFLLSTIRLLRLDLVEAQQRRADTRLTA